MRFEVFSFSHPEHQVQKTTLENEHSIERMESIEGRRQSCSNKEREF